MRSIIPYIALFLVSIVIIIPVVSSASTATVTDFNYHYNFALELPEKVHIAHVLYYATVIVFERLLPDPSPFYVNVLSMVTFMSPLLLLLFALLKQSAEGHVGEHALIILSICVFIIGPVSLGIQDPFMMGYISATVWHSPTFHALRLFIVPVSLLAFRVFEGFQYRNRNQRVFFLLLTACLVSLAVMAKPSFVIALIPGLCLFALYRVVNRRHLDWLLLTVGILLPSSVLLGMQYLINYESESGIQFGLFVLQRLSMPGWHIPIRLVQSVAFPISVYLLLFKNARHDRFLNMSWLIFFVGLIYVYFINVTGLRVYHGVFFWTGHSCAFLLVFATVRFLVRQYVIASRSENLCTGWSKRLLSGRTFAIATVFGLHVAYGLTYWFRFQSFPV